MAFGRSNSLSINTGGGGLFGQTATSQGQQSAGLFGGTANASQPQQTGGLFASSTAQQKPAGLFGGAPAAATSQPPQSTGLFGNLGKPATTTATTGGLFGSTAQSQPQQGGGLFGGALGGNTQTQTQNQPAQTGGLFGGLGQTQNQNQAQKPGGLFGASTTQQNTTSSLFGNQTQNQPQQTNSLFGGMASQNKPLGQMNSSQAIQMNDISQLKGTSRINELHPDIQKEIFALDDVFQSKIEQINKIRESIPEHVAVMQTISPDVAIIENILSTVELGLENDSANIDHLKTLVSKDADEATLSFRAIENQALPAQFRYGNNSTLSASAAKPSTTSSLDDNDDPTKPVDLVSYFDRRTNDLGRTLDTYQRQIREIELHLRTMEAGTHEKAQQLMGARNKSLDDRQQLVEALRAIEAAIVDSAKKVGKVRDDVTKQTLGAGAGLL